jgi:5'(3')-deoxyribonucleotidase
MKFSLWIDSDGVLASYEEMYKKLGGDLLEKGKVKAMRFKSMPHFFATLPLCPDARKLWNFCKSLDPDFYVLTAASNYSPTSREDKEHWYRKNFNFGGSHLVITAYPTDKQKYAGPNKILVDDNPKNCSEWERAGGIAIEHKTVDNTINQLKALYGHGEAFHAVEAVQPTYETPNLIEAFQRLPTSNVVETINNINDLD